MQGAALSLPPRLRTCQCTCPPRAEFQHVQFVLPWHTASEKHLRPEYDPSTAPQRMQPSLGSPGLVRIQCCLEGEIEPYAKGDEGNMPKQSNMRPGIKQVAEMHRRTVGRPSLRTAVGAGRACTCTGLGAACATQPVQGQAAALGAPTT